MNVVNFENKKFNFIELSDLNIHINYISESHKKHLKNLSIKVMKKLKQKHKLK